ncbi:MAG: hypothetical protein HZA52_01265 [Planctomycetes bacterium]|nr:hypothetical protein [Planctomycetota bacterium]
MHLRSRLGRWLLVVTVLVAGARLASPCASLSGPLMANAGGSGGPSGSGSMPPAARALVVP